ncbi:MULTISPECIES: AprI/Inh family metalloprotease inhibitor [unclassified Chelatococcus]|jgi:hypothetical protein|uniref:AprI/Inh family metalloprotease inhibitor n=1 Tax=unclassified Chelatococcus TaxID=2638111 RepID=UPI001BCADAC8|nr:MULTISPECIES: AprI/Inh family metalloprotease inhibitor [unclassified Chelatococcus]CAH1653992.1 Protease inhibitor Inh [Hyphomicrobiales bacterium]MBS7740189.1 AprI/Inh family metalloprotease inhibitor [Chelatococcus sp. HY11]MBX3544982.1 AprI/Inh family metalloprotease inhibitor [Chelatococcus sp.]MCO5079914.1 AprI/Inh family metalloprotease inhibitor [Chelatococcus sp.]CAH1685548.1 Protease inhibitor Inh [Hyphomicrobiales bacterium]
MQLIVRDFGPKWPVVAAVMLLGLGACTSSDRFSDRSGGVQPRPGSNSRAISDDMEPIAPGPAPTVIASPLPPAPGTSVASDPNFPTPGAPAPVDPMLGQPKPDNMANLGTPGSGASAPTPRAPTSRTAITGTWTAREATGGSCRVTLSSSPSLDLYRASTSGCANKDLQSVNAWDLRDDEVYLYSRGSVVARLKGGSGAYNGVIAKSGAPVTISR